MKKLTTLEMVEGDGPIEINWVTSTPDAATIDRLIHTLGHMRAGMQPPVPARLDPRVEMTPNVSLLLGNDAQGRTMLSIRHQGYGWITFRLDQGAKDYLVGNIPTL